MEIIAQLEGLVSELKSAAGAPRPGMPGGPGGSGAPGAPGAPIGAGGPGGPGAPGAMPPAAARMPAGQPQRPGNNQARRMFGV
jgi:hypothetical protein